VRLPPRRAAPRAGGGGGARGGAGPAAAPGTRGHRALYAAHSDRSGPATSRARKLPSTRRAFDFAQGPR
jgi:hypothetical protein